MSVPLTPYHEYKDSGLPWMGQIPKHWEVCRSKYLLREVNVRSSDGQEQLLSVSQYTGVTPRHSRSGDDEPDTRALSLAGYKLVAPNDLVVNIMIAWNGSLGVSNSPGIVSPAYCVYRFNNPAHPWYYHNLLRLPVYKGRIKVASTGVIESRLRLYSDDLFRIEVLVPPKREQTGIAHFVNVFGSHIERLIRGKRRLIELLNEQRQSIIYRAVTRGLDLNVHLKPSGVEWLGKIPEHWIAFRLKQTTRILRGKFSHRPRNDPALYDGPYPFIQTGDVSRAKMFITNYSQTLNEKGLAVSKLFPSGTLVMTIAANIGDVALLGFDACFPDSIVGLVPFKGVDKDYLYLVLCCTKNELLRVAPVNTQGNLNVERIGSMGIPIPPIHEQQGIIAFIKKKIGPFDTAIVRTERQIALLQEYRVRLITEVVTGKLDVRGVELPSLGDAEAPDHLEISEDTEADEMTDTEETTNGDEQ